MGIHTQICVPDFIYSDVTDKKRKNAQKFSNFGQSKKGHKINFWQACSQDTREYPLQILATSSLLIFTKEIFLTN